MLDRSRGVALAVMLCTLLLSCEGTAKNGPDPSRPSDADQVTLIPPPTTSKPDGAQPSRTLIGAWASPACGERKYARNITFDAGGTFTAQDLVSPCPPGMACVWSGIVERVGKYDVRGADVTLSVEKGDAKMGAPFPTKLVFDPSSSSALVEAPDPATQCAYVAR